MPLPAATSPAVATLDYYCPRHCHCRLLLHCYCYCNCYFPCCYRLPFFPPLPPAETLPKLNLLIEPGSNPTQCYPPIAFTAC